MNQEFENLDHEAAHHAHPPHSAGYEDDEYLAYYPYSESSQSKPLNQSFQETHEFEPHSKPFLSRMLNATGVSTSPGIDWMFDWLQVLFIAGLLAWITMSYGMVRMRVPTGSMEDTILVGDSFFVDKFTYALGLQDPEPGDIVVFWHTEDSKFCPEHQFLFWEWGERVNCKERYVKRLIAIGPAQVTIRQGNLYVDGRQLTDPAFDRDYVCTNAEHRNPALRSAEGCTHIVPEYEYFVMGDNTRNSSDSRYWGTVKASEFIGEPFFRVWPSDRIGPMNEYLGSKP